MRPCRDCNRALPLDQFSKRSAYKDGLNPHCKECAKRRMDAWRAANADRVKEYTRKRLAAVTDEDRARRRLTGKAYYERHRTSYRHHKIRRFGIEPAQYDAMEREQGGLCAVCGEPETDRALAIDHDHVTGQVRGLLCKKCNLAIGQFRDRPEFLLQAVTYLNPPWLDYQSAASDNFVPKSLLVQAFMRRACSDA